jgi:alkylation response protein AidB-like acyl-CoA dehydrogenase
MMASSNLRLPAATLPRELDQVRQQVRCFVADERAAGRLIPTERIGFTFCAQTSRRLGDAGWIGMTWPRQYGGHERSALERYVVTEELLAAAVPVGAHWVADRQSGPVLLRFGTEEQRRFFLPGIARGECCFCIGMSEPEAGSDLAALRSRAERTNGGWRVNGRKIWTSNAHRAHYMIALLRTSREESRHGGLSQFIVKLDSPGVRISPVLNMAREHEFNEVTLEDVLLPDEALVGEEGNGWNQVSAELTYERSGPERWLSSFPLLEALAQALQDDEDHERLGAIGRLAAHLMTLRQMSIAVAVMLQAGATPNVEAAVVKDLGTNFEQELVRVVRDIVLHAHLLGRTGHERLAVLLAHAQMWAPAFTIRGGTSEILRGVIARGLGLR